MTSSMALVAIPKMAISAHPSFRHVAAAVGTRNHSKSRQSALGKKPVCVPSRSEESPHQGEDKQAGLPVLQDRRGVAPLEPPAAPLSSSASAPTLREQWRQNHVQDGPTGVAPTVARSGAEETDAGAARRGLGQRLRRAKYAHFSLPSIPLTVDSPGGASSSSSNQGAYLGEDTKPLPPELKWPGLLQHGNDFEKAAEFFEKLAASKTQEAAGRELLPPSMEQESPGNASCDISASRRGSALLSGGIPLSRAAEKKHRRHARFSDVDEEMDNFEVGRAGEKGQVLATSMKSAVFGAEASETNSSGFDYDVVRHGSGGREVAAYPSSGRRKSAFRASMSLTSLFRTGMATSTSSRRATRKRTTVVEQPVERLRRCLLDKYGTVRKAFASLDAKNTGEISVVELTASLERDGVVCEEDKDSIGAIRSLDIWGRGFVCLADMLTVFGDVPAQEGEHEWQFLTTMEKWTRWCDTIESQPKRDARIPTWQADEEFSATKSTMQDKRNQEREVMRKMMAQGIHRTKNGLQMCAKHLPKELDIESVQKYRRETLDNVERRGKRIKGLLADWKQNRRDVSTLVQDMQELGDNARRAKLLEMLAKQKEQEKKHDTAAPPVLSIDAVNMFSEDTLALEEQAARALARNLGIPIPDVEAIQAHYKMYSTKGRGVSREHFPNLLIGLLGDRKEFHQEKFLDDLWSDIDSDRSGRITLDEYLVWHHTMLQPPRLSIKTYPPTQFP